MITIYYQLRLASIFCVQNSGRNVRKMPKLQTWLHFDKSLLHHFNVCERNARHSPLLITEQELGRLPKLYNTHFARFRPIVMRF